MNRTELNKARSDEGLTPDYLLIKVVQFHCPNSPISQMKLSMRSDETERILKAIRDMDPEQKKELFDMVAAIYLNEAIGIIDPDAKSKFIEAFERISAVYFSPTKELWSHESGEDGTGAVARAIEDIYGPNSNN
jgi:hypothetical protein